MFIFDMFPFLWFVLFILVTATWDLAVYLVFGSAPTITYRVKYYCITYPLQACFVVFNLGLWLGALLGHLFL
jgi:hypothetical protein